jgi:hypothetical protein
MNKNMLLALLLGGAVVGTPLAEADLTCTGAGCVTANVQVSSSDSNTTVAGIVLAASPAASKDLAITANYFVDMSTCFSSMSGASSSSVFLSLSRGSTWTGGCQPPSGTDIGPQFDPMAAYDSNGNLFSGQLGNTNTTEGVFLQELPFGSAVWGDFFPTLTFTDSKTVDFYDFDSPALVIDNQNSPNCLYVTAWEVGYKLSNHDPLTAVAVGHSCDAGASWTTTRASALVAAPKFATYSRVAVAKDGTVLATWIENNDGKNPKVFASTSSDGGNTWPTKGQIMNISITQPAAANCNNSPQVDRALPHTCVRMYYFPQLASTYSNSTGQQFQAVYPNYVNKQVSIYYTSSLDGALWSSPTALSTLAGDTTATGDQFEPCIASPSQTSNMIGVAWLDTRNSPAGKPDTLYDAYGTISQDGGMTWGAVHRISSASGSTTVETEPNSEYLGDWTGCAWQNGIFYYAFPSTANGSNQVAMIAGMKP